MEKAFKKFITTITTLGKLSQNIQANAWNKLMKNTTENL